MPCQTLNRDKQPHNLGRYYVAYRKPQVRACFVTVYLSFKEGLGDLPIVASEGKEKVLEFSNSGLLRHGVDRREP